MNNRRRPSTASELYTEVQRTRSAGLSRLGANLGIIFDIGIRGERANRLLKTLRRMRAVDIEWSTPGKNSLTPYA
jgi:hypothetical protein